MNVGVSLYDTQDLHWGILTFLQTQFCFDNNHVHAEYQFWNMELIEFFQVPWHQDFQLLNNMSSYCQHDLLYGFNIYFHDHLCCENKMIMHNTTFVKWFDHFGIGPTFVKILHHIRWYILIRWCGRNIRTIIALIHDLNQYWYCYLSTFLLILRSQECSDDCQMQTTFWGQGLRCYLKIA